MIKQHGPLDLIYLVFSEAPCGVFFLPAACFFDHKLATIQTNMIDLELVSEWPW